jgi:ornithine decarboxylase
VPPTAASVAANPLDDEDEKCKVACTIFGPTCDGFDKIADNVVDLPEMEIGDRLVWLCMGAYTTAASTTFTGFTQPQ